MNDNQIRQFYKELGNLFYSIAATDNKITEKEKEILDKEVQYSWKHFENSKDRFGSDRSFLIEFEFETMEDMFVSSENAFRSFENYFTENEKMIEPGTRKRIYNSARHIAESFRKINRNELELLERLKKLLKI
jgi:hypothetical protein